MTTPFVLAVPSKGRLQENAEAFFTRAGLALAKPRGARDYRGTIPGLDNVEIAYLSASEIASQLARGAVHLGVTGEDLVRESIVDAENRVLLIDNLGFGSANVVVAVPQAWIDVRTMADLDAGQVGDSAAIVAGAARLDQLQAGAAEERLGVFLQPALGRHGDDQWRAHDGPPPPATRSIHTAKPTAGIGDFAPSRLSSSS